MLEIVSVYPFEVDWHLDVREDDWRDGQNNGYRVDYDHN